MSSGHRIAVTGIGLWTALARGREDNLSAFRAGKTAFAPSRLLAEHGLSGRLVAEIALPAPPPGDTTRAEWFAAATVAEALAQANIDPRAQRAKVELIASVSTGGMFETEQLLTRLWRGAEPSPDDFTALRGHPISATVAATDRALGPFARTATLCSACSGGALALGLGLTRLRLGRADVVVAGGVDSLSRLTVAGFAALQSLDPDGCHPFSATRKGLVLGEAAAFLVLEREDTARARGASILGYLGGYGVRSEAHHITHPEPNGTTPADVMARALADAAVGPADVTYVSAHGTGTPLNDAMEARALALAFGPHARKLAVSSQKGQIGHTLAAAGAVEAAVTLLAMGAGLVLPNVARRPIDPAFDLSIVGTQGEARAVSVALSSSFGFGGTDAALVLLHADVPASTAAVSEAPRVFIAASAGFDLEREATLDADRTRRFDAVSRAYSALVDAALADTDGASRTETGLVAGSAFGSTEAAAAFFARVEDKGARFASPAEFPNLVPSSAGANAAIYAGLRGPSLTVAELSLSFFGALETSVDLIADGRAEAMVAAHVEVPSKMVERALAQACGSALPAISRGRGGGALLLRRDDRRDATSPAAGPALVFATVCRAGALTLPPPGEDARALIVVVTDDAAVNALLAASPWASVRREIMPLADVAHEAGAAVASVLALARLASGEVSRVLVIQAQGGRVGCAVFAAS